MKQHLLFIILVIFTFNARAQFGGSSTYDFLNLTSSARINALGGNQVGILDSAELSFSYYNPASLMPTMHNDISINYIDYIGDIKVGYASYARNYNKIGTFAAGIQYINYGNIQEALVDGTLTGNKFRVSEYALNIIYSKNIWRKLNVGVTAKPIFSSFESYNSFGIAADVGITYADLTGNFNFGIVAKNMGTQITTYRSINGLREPLPFDLQAGFSQQLAHAPLRFSATFHHLTHWDLSDKATWEHENSDDIYNYYGESDNALKQLLRHLVLGVEISATQNLTIGMGYNFQRKYQLSYAENVSLVGLSGGFTVNVSKFRVSYAIASYHLSGTSNIFSVTTNLSEFIR